MKIYVPLRNPILMGLVASIGTLLLYLFVVVVTTPNLPFAMSIQAAFQLNGIVLLGSSFGMGVQTFLITYGCRLPCPATKNKAAIGAAGAGTAVSSFFSFFSLTTVGCCGLWLYVLSLLPGIFGVGLTGFFITYSNILSLLGLVGVAFSILLMLHNIRKALKQLEPNKNSV